MAVKFQQHRLDNGLTILAEVNDAAHSAAAGFFARVGTRDEPAELMGVSHFLEHMMFKGTARRTADQVNQDFDRIGADYNAFTMQEMTGYFAHVLPEYTADALDLLSDIMRPTLRGEDFEMEKNVILEEIGMYMDRPFFRAYEDGMATYFDGHPLGYRILGSTQSITDLTREAMADYFQHRYSPDNMVVSLTGRVNFGACVEQLARACGHWEPTGADRAHPPVQPRPETRTFTDEKLNSSYLLAIMPGPSRQDADRYTAAVLANLLGDSEGSRLYWELIDPGLADEAEFAHQGFDQAGTFLAYASSPPAKADQIEEKLFHVLDHFADDLDDAEVERAKNKIATGMMLQDERPAGRMVAVGGNWLYTGEYHSLRDELDRLMAVTPDDIRRLAERYPRTDRAVIRLRPA